MGGMALVVVALKLIEMVLDHADGNSPEENKALASASSKQKVAYLGKQKIREQRQNAYQDEYADAQKASRSSRLYNEERFVSHDERKDYH